MVYLKKVYKPKDENVKKLKAYLVKLNNNKNGK
jgi:hypothetical protein